MHAVEEDFGIRQFQIVRKYGKPNGRRDMGSKVELYYKAGRVDVHFVFENGWMVETHIDYRRGLEEFNSPEQRLRRQKKESTRAVVEAFRGEYRKEPQGNIFFPGNEYPYYVRTGNVANICRVRLNHLEGVGVIQNNGHMD